MRAAVRGSSTSRTWARSRPAGRTRWLLAAAAVQRRRARSDSAARSTACSAARTAAFLTTSSPIASRADRYLTVTNAANHERDLDWFRAHADGFDVELARPRRRLRDARRAGAARARDRAGDRRRAAAGAHDRRDATHRRHPRARRWAPATPARTASSCSLARGRRPRVWNALPRRGAHPAGLAARDTLRTEACYHLYGNDLSTDRGPIEAGLGWCCKEDTGFIGADAVRAARERPARPRSSSPFVIDRAGHRAPGRRRRRRRRGHQRHLLAEPRGRHRHGLPARSSGPPRARELEIDVRGQQRAARVVETPPALRERVRSRRTVRLSEASMAEASYPPSCCITPSTTGRGSTGDVATFGHHLARAGRARRGRLLRAARGRRDSCTQGRALHRGRVGQGRLRRDRAALRRGDRGQRGARRRTRG